MHFNGGSTRVIQFLKHRMVIANTCKNVREKNYRQRFHPFRFSRKPPVFLGSFPPYRFHFKTSCFFVFFEKESNLLYLFSEIEKKNSASNASLLMQLKKPERIVKIQDRLHSLRTLQTTKTDRSVVENSSC